jgi:hypothetical protein
MGVVIELNQAKELCLTLTAPRLRLDPSPNPTLSAVASFEEELGIVNRLHFDCRQLLGA